MSKVVQDASLARPPLTQVLNTLPPPLTVTLIGLHPHIARIRRIVEIVSWKSPWEESWLALAGWWAVCLCSGFVLRYSMPLIIFAFIILQRWRTSSTRSPPPVSEDTLHQAMSDLSTIQQLLPNISTVHIPSDNLTILGFLRTLAIIYLPYLALTYFVRLRIIVAVAGTIVLTWRARWAVLIRRALWRSAHIRWAVYLVWSRISGQPLPPRVTPVDPSSQVLTIADTKAPQLPVNRIRFLFTVYENQRWWMGLDWTAALLPGERPSWCTSTQQPVSPPAAFALPAPTTVFLPDPDPKRMGKRVKRTALWSWEEPEWRVCVRKEGLPLTRVERPLPVIQEEGAGASASRILKAAGRMRPASMSEVSPERQRRATEGERLIEDVDGKSGRGDDVAGEEPSTDADGWVYGDNKWEGGSAKGGIGKYTRYRRWSRVAVLTETIELVDAGELGIHREEPVEAPSGKSTPNNSELPTPAATEIPLQDLGSRRSSTEDDRSRLRQRLKAVVRGNSASS